MTDIQELKRLAVAYEVGDTHFIDDPEFWEKVTPSTILSLIERIEALEQNTMHLHIKLAGEKLRADQGWERYEAANRHRNALEAYMVAQQDKGKGTV